MRARVSAVLLPVVLSALGLVPGFAAPALAAPTGVSGSAFVDLVHADALEFPGTVDLADVSIAPATALVDAAGLPDRDGATEYARATNLDAVLVDGALPLTDLLVNAEQSAPPRNEEPATSELLDVPLAPVLDATVARATAFTPGYGTQCPPDGEPLARGQSFLADAMVLPDGSGSGTVTIHNDEGATVSTTSDVSLVTVEDQQTKAVQAEAVTQLTSILIADLVRVNVLAPPRVTAIATGVPGTASVTYTEPILQIVDPASGDVLGELNAASGNTRFDALAPLLILEIGTLEAEIAEDGTSASGEAVLLDIEILSGAPVPGTTVGLSIAAGTVSATAPAGGVVCGGAAPDPGNPLADVRKYPTSDLVAPGETFDYVLNVPNRGPCTLTNVTVADVITGPAGTTVVATEPAGATVDGLTVTWTDQGPIEPGGAIQYRITVQVPQDAPNGAMFSDTLRVTADCDGQPVDTEVTVDLPRVGAPPNAGCTLHGSNKAETHLEVVPGQTFSYLIQLVNSGDTTCTAIAVTDTLVDGVTFASCSDGCANEGQTVTWTIPELEPGAARTLVVTVTVDEDASGQLPNTATATPSNGDPVTVETPGPVVTAGPVPAPPRPATFAPVDLPDTGYDLMAVGLAAMVAAVVLRRRSRVGA